MCSAVIKEEEGVKTFTPENGFVVLVSGFKTLKEPTFSKGWIEKEHNRNRSQFVIALTLLYRNIREVHSFDIYM